MRRIRVIVTCALAAAVVAVAAITVAPVVRDQATGPPGQPSPVRPVVDLHSSLGAEIEAARTRLRALPGDWATWAQLGSAYVEQARLTADPTYYAKAEGALDESLRLRSDDNWQAMVGQGALANARHNVVAGLSWGRRAEDLNPDGGSVHAVIVDALTQLGDYGRASEAVARMLELHSGLTSFTRASYDRELHGDSAGAAEIMRRALASSTQPADIASCLFHLGELAFNAGDPRSAATRYRAAVTADPRYHRAFAGLGKAHAALGQTRDAVGEYERAVRALPSPQLLIEYGDLLASLGRETEAGQQYDRAEAAQARFADSGDTDHLLSATFLADHGRAADALDHAQVEWSQRPNVWSADALAWALHRDGRDEEALTYADIANSLSWRNAAFRYHRGAIQAALGDAEAAREELTSALAINPSFNPVQAPVAQRLLSTLGEDS